MRNIRVVKLSRNTVWANDPGLNYNLKDGETILSASHGYASGNLEWLTLIIQGPLIMPGKEEVGD
jgi:hypothetical protein